MCNFQKKKKGESEGIAFYIHLDIEGLTVY